MSATTATLHATGSITPYEERQDEVGLCLRYDSRRPYEVTMTVSVYGDSADWTVSREVLCVGVLWQTPSGLHDFQVLPLNDQLVQLRLHTNDPGRPGQLYYITASRLLLMEFIRRTLAKVPAGGEGEFLQIDHHLDILMGRTTP